MNGFEADISRFERLAPRVVKALEKRNFEAYYCKTLAEGAEKALSLIREGATVSWGGSLTIVDSGLLDKVKSGNYKCIDRDTASNPAERTELMRKALSADVFLTSFNAISEDGIIINTDGNGNRVAAITFGPQTVIALVGMNKIAKTEADALVRARTIAAPRNAERLNRKTTGCAQSGTCQNCLAPDCICAIIQTLRFSQKKGRIKIVLTAESAGY